jgi:hypothetical protein
MGRAGSAFGGVAGDGGGVLAGLGAAAGVGAGGVTVPFGVAGRSSASTLAGSGLFISALFDSAAGALRALLAVDLAFPPVVSVSADGVDFAFGLRGLAGVLLFVVPSSGLSSSVGFVRRGFFGVAGGSIIAPPLAVEH